MQLISGGEIFMQQMSSKHAAKFHAGNFQSANFLFVQLISVQVISCAGNLPSVQLISVQVISRAGNCMQVIGSSKSDSGNFHAVKLSLPKKKGVLFILLLNYKIDSTIINTVCLITR